MIGRRHKYLSAWRASLANSRGIMMVEVLVAMLIMTVGLTIVVQSMMQALGATVFSADYTLASLEGDNVSSQAMIDYSGGGQGADAAGEPSSGDDVFRHTSEMQAVEDLPGLLRLLKVNVAWRSGRKDKSLDLMSYIVVKNDTGS